MKTNLAKTLIDKQVLKRDTEVTALYNAIDLSGQHRAMVSGPFTIIRVIDASEPIFELASTIDGRRRRVLSEAIIKIDGMDPIRLARNYNIKPDGSITIPGKRRGRKPKAPAEIAPPLEVEAPIEPEPHPPTDPGYPGACAEESPYDDPSYYDDTSAEPEQQKEAA